MDTVARRPAPTRAASRPVAPRGAGRVRALLTLLVSTLLFSLVGAPFAHACSCVGLTFDEATEEMDLIAEITILKRIGESEDGWRITYSAAVERVWKGEQSRQITLTTAEDTAACGLGPLPVGETLLVWAYGEAGDYATTWCNIPMDAEDDVRSQLTEALGEPADLTDQPLRGNEAPVLLYVGGALIVLGVLVTIAAVIIAVTVFVVLRRRAGRSGP